MCFKLWRRGGGRRQRRRLQSSDQGVLSVRLCFVVGTGNGIEIQFLTLLFIEQWVDCGFDERRCTAGTNESRVVRSQLGIQFVSFVFILLVIGSARCPIIGKKKKNDENKYNSIEDLETSNVCQYYSSIDELLS